MGYSKNVGPLKNVLGLLVFGIISGCITKIPYRVITYRLKYRPSPLPAIA